MNGSYVQFQQRMVHDSILQSARKSHGFTWEDYLSLDIKPSKQFMAFKCAKSYKTLLKINMPEIRELSRIQFDESIKKQLRKSSWQEEYNNIWFGDYLIQKGFYGQGVSRLFQATEACGIYASNSVLERAAVIYHICTHGIEIKLPWKIIKIFCPSPVMISDNGTYLIQSMNVKLLFRYLSMLGNYIKNPRENLYHTLEKTLEDLKWSFLIQFNEALLKDRGHTMAGRSSTGNRSLKKVIYPMSLLLAFVGYEKIGNYWRKTPSTRIRKARRRQIGEETARLIDKAVERSKNEYHLLCLLNGILQNVDHLLFRHPVLGALPLLKNRVMVKAGIHTIIVPQDLADRFTGLNSDDDGDIVYLLPIAPK